VNATFSFVVTNILILDSSNQLNSPVTKRLLGIRLLNARPVPASVSNGRVALPHNHHDPTASVHVQSVAGEEKSLNDLVTQNRSIFTTRNLSFSFLGQ
jgi:hypothetical protein